MEYSTRKHFYFPDGAVRFLYPPSASTAERRQHDGGDGLGDGGGGLGDGGGGLGLGGGIGGGEGEGEGGGGGAAGGIGGPAQFGPPKPSRHLHSKVWQSQPVEPASLQLPPASLQWLAEQ